MKEYKIPKPKSFEEKLDSHEKICRGWLAKKLPPTLKKEKEFIMELILRYRDLVKENNKYMSNDEVTQEDIDEVLLKSKYNFDDFEENAEKIEIAIEEVESEIIANEHIGGVVPLPHEMETSSLEKRINDLEKRQQEFEEEVLKQLTDLHNDIVNHINYNHK